VCRWTPARSAIPLIVVRAGPTLVCRPTAASTIRCRVSACRLARSFNSYFLFIAQKCTANLDKSKTSFYIRCTLLCN
jgi:hypothetical protein